jgi:glycosyltransferase involved in cell wall biosynthesis
VASGWGALALGRERPRLWSSRLRRIANRRRQPRFHRNSIALFRFNTKRRLKLKEGASRGARPVTSRRSLIGWIVPLLLREAFILKAVTMSFEVAQASCYQSSGKVAAVIPVRNRAAMIGDAIRSALAQTYPLKEIIIVDDGSTDNTAEVVRSFTDRRVKLIQQGRRGACAARNVGWRATDAEWIGFLDSDDIWMAEKIQHQMECAVRDETISACFVGFREKTRNGYGATSDPVAQAVSIEGLRMGNGVGPTSICMVRRSALEQVEGWDESLPSCQDWDLWLKLSKVGALAVVPTCLVEFNQDSDRRISRDADSILHGHRIVFNRIIREAHWSERPLLSAMHAVRLSYMMASIGRHRSALYYAAKSIALRPNLHAIGLLAKSLNSRSHGQSD